MKQAYISPGAVYMPVFNRKPLSIIRGIRPALLNIKLSLNMRFPYLHFVPLAYNHITHGLNNSFYTQNLRKQPKKVKRVNFIINIYPKIIILTSIFIKKCPCFCAYFCLYYHVVKRR